jgi:deoxyribodipyrimidine photo-lyase
MWSIGGIHDKQFPEHEIFGKVRIMTNKGCQGKFDVDAYVNRLERRRSELHDLL